MGLDDVEGGGATELRAVVFTATVAVADVVPVSVTMPGVTLQVAPEGAPVQAKVTVPAKPCDPGVIVRVLVPDCPAVSVSEPGFAETV